MEETPTPDLPGSNRKAGLIGGVVGSLGLAASIFALTATAGASGPVLQAQDSASEPAAAVDETVLDDDAFPDEEAWAEYDACIDAVFESQGFDIDEAFADVEIFDMDEFEGDVDEFDFGPAVSIMDGEDMSFAEFGEGDGSITITKTGEDISVTSDGDVTLEEFDWDDVEGNVAILDGEILEGDIDLFDGEILEGDIEMFEELDEALSSCDDQLPEGIELEHGFAEAEAFDLSEDAELTEAS